jgi:hypothetical protein
MGIQREPGQKGVNWSNIAVGMCLPSPISKWLVPQELTLRVLGGIMNMV